MYFFEHRDETICCGVHLWIYLPQTRSYGTMRGRERHRIKVGGSSDERRAWGTRVSGKKEDVSMVAQIRCKHI